MFAKKNGYCKKRHSCFLLQYHLVLVTKCRKPVIHDEIKYCLYSKIYGIFRDRGLNILEVNGEADHVHILFEADSFTAPGELASVVKTQTSRFVRKAYGDTLLKEYYWKPVFWSDSYFITTVSENSLDAVQRYIQNQPG